MAREKTMRVRLTIEGPLSDVLDVVGMAMAGGLMKEYHLDEETLHVAKVDDFFGGSERVSRSWEVGDRIRLVYAKSSIGKQGGEIGTITRVYYQGKRSKVAVRWDDNTEDDIGGSFIEKVRK